MLRFIEPKVSVRSPSPSVTSSDARAPATPSSVFDAIANRKGAIADSNGLLPTVSSTVKEAIMKIEMTRKPSQNAALHCGSAGC